MQRPLPHSLLLSVIAALCGCMQPAAPTNENEPSRTPAVARVPSHHRPVAAITVQDATALLPTLDAKTVTAPHVTPQQRVLARYCYDGVNLVDRAESLAGSLRGQWTEVSVQHVKNNRVIIRAQQGPYALRASVAPDTSAQCGSGQAALAEISVFKPMGGGGAGPARRRG